MTTDHRVTVHHPSSSGSVCPRLVTLAASSSPFAATVESWRGDVSSIVPTPTSPPGTAGKFAVPPSLTDAIYGQLPSPLDRRGRMQY